MEQKRKKEKEQCLENTRVFSHAVEKKQESKERGRAEKPRRVLFGLGMFGLVGWSVAIPTLAGVALGVWADVQWPGPVSWTLNFLLIGVVAGCFNAWYWVRRVGGAE